MNHAVQRADNCLEEESQLRHRLADAGESNLAGSGQQSIIPSALKAWSSPAAKYQLVTVEHVQMPTPTFLN